MMPGLVYGSIRNIEWFIGEAGAAEVGWLHDHGEWTGAGPFQESSEVHYIHQFINLFHNILLVFCHQEIHLTPQKQEHSS